MKPFGIFMVYVSLVLMIFSSCIFLTSVFFFGLPTVSYHSNEQETPQEIPAPVVSSKGQCDCDDSCSCCDACPGAKHPQQ